MGSLADRLTQMSGRSSIAQYVHNPNEPTKTLEGSGGTVHGPQTPSRDSPLCDIVAPQAGAMLYRLLAGEAADTGLVRSARDELSEIAVNATHPRRSRDAAAHLRLRERCRGGCPIYEHRDPRGPQPPTASLGHSSRPP
jgi:hypothetical protein